MSYEKEIQLWSKLINDLGEDLKKLYFTNPNLFSLLTKLLGIHVQYAKTRQVYNTDLEIVLARIVKMVPLVNQQEITKKLEEIEKLLNRLTEEREKEKELTPSFII